MRRCQHRSLIGTDKWPQNRATKFDTPFTPSVKRPIGLFIFGGFQVTPGSAIRYPVATPNGFLLNVRGLILTDLLSSARKSSVVIGLNWRLVVNRLKKELLNPPGNLILLFLMCRQSEHNFN